MMSRNMMQTEQNENGNVLFLTLMAFTLFVALAYVVMHSFRGGDDSNREITLRSAASVTQYSSAIRTGVTRMLLRDVDLSDLDFSVPDSASAASAQADHMVFNPAGGGVTYKPVPAEVVNQVQENADVFNAKRNGNWYFTKIGISNVGTGRKELVALLYDVKQQFCEDINYQITGSSTVPELGYASETILEGLINLSGPLVNGQPFLCIRSNDAYIYYHVLAEQ